MITLYGTPATRTRRVLWLLEELGLAYTLERVVPREASSQSPAYLALNPMGKVPTLVDGNLTLSESLAINLYLARKYGKSDWWPNAIENEARLWQWTLFAATELDPLLFRVILETLIKPEAERNIPAAHQALDALKRPFTMLESHLSDKNYLCGDVFTLADLNVAATCTMARIIAFDFAAFPSVANWLKHCWSRQAFLKVDSMS